MTNDRPFPAYLVLYEWAVETNLKFSVKAEEESLSKQLFMKIQLSTLVISANLNKAVI